ncbi:MAG: YidC/Oxa1 family insertase periplasmic-domain containing protein [Puniceicoccales bacterium]|jgi:YidC/Oxa1 family membrane protein insertase|nr:YidC/Oxa1 family insertase periplasmic-domain containing protein [Puniceicoccales bacterium]
MDKKSIAIGIALLTTAIGIFAWNGINQSDHQPAKTDTAAATTPAATAATPAPTAPSAAATPATAAAPTATAAPVAPAATPTTSAATVPPAATPAPPAPPPSTTSTASTSSTTSTAAPPPAAPADSLENGTLRLDFSPANGGGIANIALLKQADTLDNRKDSAAHPYLFNRTGLEATFGHPSYLPDGRAVWTPTPIPSILGLTFRLDNDTRLWTPVFTRVSAANDKTRAIFTATLVDPVTQSRILVTRTYSFAQDAPPVAGTIPPPTDPHVVRVETKFRVQNDKPAYTLARFQLNLGTLPPTEGDYSNQFLGVSACDGDNFDRTELGAFSDSSGVFGIGKSAAKTADIKSNAAQKWKWVSATNQYFAAILQFDTDTNRRLVTDLRVTPLRKIPPPGQISPPYTATGDVGFQLPPLNPGQEITLTADFYVGTREYARLAALGHDQEKAVHFAKLWFISMDPLCKIFVVILDLLHGLTGAWALAIIALTVIIKAITWPLVTAQQRSAEKMRKFQGPMKAIREKYKDDQKRQQLEMMNLYKEHKINPLAGCLPVLIQIPIFSGLFFTFQSLAQLRFQSFLWITDLSMPDTIPGLEDFTLLGVHLHILPILMGVTMLLNMKLTPMPNMEGQQKMIFYGMMIMFPVICYGMPSALMLYYAVQNVLTIFQTFHTRRRIRIEETNAPATAVVVEKPRGKGKYKW